MTNKGIKDFDIKTILEKQSQLNLESQYNIYLKHMDAVCSKYFNNFTHTLIQPLHFESQYKFEPTCKLTPQRQLEYFNTLVPKNPLTVQQMTEYLNDKNKTLIKRRRNCGVFINSTNMVYGWDNKIKTVEFDISQIQNKIDFKIKPVYQHQGQGEVMEILNFGGEEQVMVRQLSRIIILDKNQIKYRYLAENQITNSYVNPYKQNQIILTTYASQSQTTELVQYQVGDQPRLLKSFDKYIVAAQQMNRQSIIAATYDTIKTYDTRTKYDNIFYIESNRVQRRILDLVWLRTCIQNTPYFIIGNTTHVEVFDIRNNKCSIGQHKHYCEDSPPINYSMFQSNYSTTSLESLFNSNKNEIQKIVIGNSPNQFGNSIFFKLPESLEETEKISGERYMAALSENKRYYGNKYRMSSLYNYSNAKSGEQSISIIPYLFQGKLIFFHGGSHGSLKVQIFNKDHQRIPIENKEKDRVQKYFQRMEEQRYIENHSIVKQQEGDDNYKINYAIYRCISDSDLRLFKDQLFAKSKMGDIDISKDCIFTPSPITIRNKEFKQRKGLIDDQFLDQLQQEW